MNLFYRVDIHLQATPQTREDKQFHVDSEAKIKLLSATTVTQHDSNVGDKPRKSLPLQLPDQMSYTTHRTVTPILQKTICVTEDRPHGYSVSKEAQSSELVSHTSSLFMVPSDYDVSKSPVLSDPIPAQVVTEATTQGKELEYSPDFDRVLTEFEKTVSDFEFRRPQVPLEDSPQHSDSELEFFDCRQTFSDLSEPDEEKRKHDVSYHISEPPSPLPGGIPDFDSFKESPQYAHPFLRVEGYKRFSSGSESLDEFAYDSEGSRECRAEGELPVCEELPSRDQAGYYDDDDILGRVRD